MKFRVYNNGNGWFFPICNYKNKEEKPLFVSVKFAQNHCPELTYVPDENGKCKKTIFINESSLNKYYNDKGDLKLTMTIFEYERLTDIDLQEKGYEKDETGMFGNDNKQFQPDDLPFY